MPTRWTPVTGRVKEVILEPGRSGVYRPAQQLVIGSTPGMSLVFGLRDGGDVLEILVGGCPTPPLSLSWKWNVSGILGAFPFDPLSAAVSISRHKKKKLGECGLYEADPPPPR